MLTECVGAFPIESGWTGIFEVRMLNFVRSLVGVHACSCCEGVAACDLKL